MSTLSAHNTYITGAWLWVDGWVGGWVGDLVGGWMGGWVGDLVGGWLSERRFYVLSTSKAIIRART